MPDGDVAGRVAADDDPFGVRQAVADERVEVRRVRRLQRFGKGLKRFRLDAAGRDGQPERLQVFAVRRDEFHAPGVNFFGDGPAEPVQVFFRLRPEDKLEKSEKRPLDVRPEAKLPFA